MTGRVLQYWYWLKSFTLYIRRSRLYVTIPTIAHYVTRSLSTRADLLLCSGQLSTLHIIHHEAIICTAGVKYLKRCIVRQSVCKHGCSRAPFAHRPGIDIKLPSDPSGKPSWHTLNVSALLFFSHILSGSKYMSTLMKSNDDLDRLNDTYQGGPFVPAHIYFQDL